MNERIPPERTALTTDLCDHWNVVADHRCTNYWKHVVILDQDTEVGGKVMGGTYPAGAWWFCNMHRRIFERDRQDK